MAISSKRTQLAQQDVLPFERFWSWLQRHANCIVRAGTPDMVLYDQEDFHWHFGVEDDGNLVVEAIRGKQLVGEILVIGREVAFVQSEVIEQDEVLFECIVPTEPEPIAAYHFVLSHGFDATEDKSKPGRLVH